MKALLFSSSLVLCLVPFVLPMENRGKIAALLRWLRKDGGYISDRVAIVNFADTGLGIEAVEPIERGHVVARIPLSLLMNIEHAVVSPEFGPVLDEFDYLSDIDAMAAFLAFEKSKKNSKWKSYIDLLPDRFSTTLFASKRDLEALEGSSVKIFAERRNEAVEKTYARLSADLRRVFPDIRLTREAFLWGLSVLWSRSHSVRVLGPDSQWHQASCLIPVADLFNMAPSDEQVTIECQTNAKSTHFECLATSTVSRHSQLFVMYSSVASRRHNSHLLMDYGFVLQDNPYDCVVVETPKPRDDDTGRNLRLEILSWVPELQMPYIQLHRLNASRLLQSALMTAMRILVMPKNSLQDLHDMRGEKKGETINKIGSLPPPDELKALQRAMDFVENSLRGYPSDDEEENSEDGDGDTSSKLRKYAVVLLRGEKRILKDIAETFEQQIRKVKRLLFDDL